MPLFGLTWGSRRKDDEEDDDYEDDDDEYESYTDDDDDEEGDDDDDDDDIVEGDSNDNNNDSNPHKKDRNMIDQVVNDDQQNEQHQQQQQEEEVNVSQETNDSNEEILEPKEFAVLLQQLPPPSPEQKKTVVVDHHHHNPHRNSNDNNTQDDIDERSSNLPPKIRLLNGVDTVTNTNNININVDTVADHHQHQQQQQQARHVDTDTDDTEQQPDQNNVYELQNLLFLAIEADRVDIVQELLQQQPQQSSSSISSSLSSDNNDPASSSFHLRDYLLNPIIRVQKQQSSSSSKPKHNSSDDGEPLVSNDDDGDDRDVSSSVQFSIMNRHSMNDIPSSSSSEEYDCCTTVPPIHIAMYYGSINALNYLLRTGANPALRPNISEMNDCARWLQQQTQKPEHGDGIVRPLSMIQFLLDVPHIQQYDQCTAWEVAFGRQQQQQQPVDETNDGNSGNGSWSLFGSSGTKGKGNSRRSSSNLSASKLESIRHAFFTEAIRCISTDDVLRFQQLHCAGMPIDDNDTDDSTAASSTFVFTKWCHDFHAQQCLQYIAQQITTPTTDHPTSLSTNASTTTTATNNNSDMNGHSSTTVTGRKIPIVSEGLVSLQNRYEELDALCRSLSACLDNVAEEVSVGAGLLLSSNSNSSGAQALASHVRTVKHQREQLLDELERYQGTYQNSLDEVLHYISQFNVKQYSNGTAKGKYWAEVRVDEISDWWQENMQHLKTQGPKLHSTTQLPSTEDIASEASNSNDITETKDDDQQREKEQNMITQIMILETKIRRIRATISDLSDDNQRNQEEIERRQLMVGLQYIRTLRNEIRDIEYQIYEMKQYDIDCRNKIRTLQTYLSSSSSASTLSQPLQGTKMAQSSALPNSDSHTSSLQVSASNETTTNATSVMDSEKVETNGNKIRPNTRSTKVSKQVSFNNHSNVEYDSTQRDYTTTMVVHGPTRGFLSLNLWQMLLRIIGMGGSGNTRTATAVARSSMTVNHNPSSNTASTSRPVIII